MSTPLTPSKRPYDRNPVEPNGKGKWKNLSGFYSQNQPLKVYPGTACFRLLCPASKTGCVIGKGGNVISQIRQETGVKIRVEETVPGCDERVIVILGTDKETEVTPEKSKEDGDKEAGVSEKGDETEKDNKNDGNKESVPEKDSNSEKATSSVQKAVLLVFERMVEGESETGGGEQENVNSSTFVLRLLVFSSQVGSLLGKGGRVIKLMSAESGAQIRVLPRDKLPPCASASDELVQLTGNVDALRKALQSVSQQLLENPPRVHDSSSTPVGPSSHSFGGPFSRPEVYPFPIHPFSAQGAPYNAGPREFADYDSSFLPLIPRFHETGIPGPMRLPQEFLGFRLLCPVERVGVVIGKGGTIVNALQQETGCEIKVSEGASDSEDRIIIITGPAYPDDRISAAQEAVLRVQTRIVRAIPDNKDKIARLLVSSNQIGCLLGKGGAIISEMRKLSGAYIRVMGKDQIPKCASENEEMVQVNGEYETVQEALLQITTRLRNHFFRDAFPIDLAPYPSYAGRRELSPPGMYSHLGPPFHKFDAVGGLPPHDGYYPHDDRSPFMHHRPSFPSHISDRNSWVPQGIFEGSGPTGLSDFEGAPQRRISGRGGVNQPTIISSTTVEVAVPNSLLPIIYGEDGGCLKQIRQISDAKITITEPKPGSPETVIIISGTPEQTHAAQSLIQAFVMSETEST